MNPFETVRRLSGVARRLPVVPLAATPRASVAHPPLGGFVRGYVSYAGIKELRKVHMAKVMAKAFAFQQLGHCIPNAQRMQAAAAADLKASGHAVDAPKAGVRLKGLMTADELTELTDKAGPVQLTIYGIVPPSDGGGRYLSHHAVVLAGTFTVFTDSGLRRLGIVVDGNDLQSNAVTRAMGEWQRTAGDTRHISELGPADFEAFEAHMLRQGTPVDVLQAAFRIVDLDQFAAAGEDGFRYAVEHFMAPRVHPTGTEMAQPVFSAADLVVLRTAVNQGVLAVEAFPLPERYEGRDAMEPPS